MSAGQHLSRPRPLSFVWLLGCWVVMFWRLGYPSFWDPDEAHYAETTREMLASHQWLVPLYNGAPFFDKPPLFHTLQMLAFKVLGPTELAARAVPAAAAMLIVGCVAWLGRTLFDREVGKVGALMFALLPATFALSSYAILDMVFTLFLFGGVALVAAALMNRPGLQYPGYLLLAAAILTKGPLALVLAALAFLIALVIAPAARPALMRLRWGVGLAIAVGLSAPWFVYMWWRFGRDFVDGYLLHENLWLYTREVYRGQPSSFFYVRMMAVGLLPWTPLLIGRLTDALRGDRIDLAERLMWAWALAVVGFFTFSQFKLDHYVYPAAPALCLLCARAWVAAHRADRALWGASVAVFGVGGVLVGAGVILFSGLDRVPLELSRWMRLMPLALVIAGVIVIVQMILQRRPPSFPAAPAAALVTCYAAVVIVVFPSLEQAKPIPHLARLVAATAEPTDQVAMFGLNRWSSSWRFYVDRQTEILETPADLRRFFATPGRHYCAMLRGEFDALAAHGLLLRIVEERPGLFTTTGRALRAGRGAGWRQFLVATDPDPSPALQPAVPDAVPLASSGGAR